jgi:hypothetical protein
MTVILAMNPAEYCCALQGFPTAPQCAKSWSDVAGLVTRINLGVRPPELPNRLISMGCSLRERTSDDFRLK